MKKFIAILLVPIMAVIMFVACSPKEEKPVAPETIQVPAGELEDGVWPKEEKPVVSETIQVPAGELESGVWPNNEWTAHVPQPTTGTIEGVNFRNDDDRFLVIKIDWTREEAIKYSEGVQAAGFNESVQTHTYYEGLMNDVGWENYAVKDYLFSGTCYEAGMEIVIKETEIEIFKFTSVIEFESGIWPDIEWITDVPKPTVGKIGNVRLMSDIPQALSIKMDWTRKEAMAYCEKVKVAGFNETGVANSAWLLCTGGIIEMNICVSETEIRIYKATSN